MSPAASPRTAQGMAQMLGVHGVVALVAVALAAATLLMQAGPLARALFVPSAASADAPSEDGARAERFRTAFDGNLAQIDGRSMFFTPPAPPPPARAETPRGDTAPRAPTRYDGPAIIAMINGSVWFADGRRLAVGGEGDSTLSVLSQNGPWSARVLWQGVEFDVPLFERTTERFIEAPAAPEPESKPAEEPEDEKSVATIPQEDSDAGGAGAAPQEKDPA